MSRYSSSNNQGNNNNNNNYPPYSIGANSMATRSPDPYTNMNNNNNNNNNTNNNAVLSARGRSESQQQQQPQQNFDQVLESQGLNSSSVELGLLQSKLRSAYADLQRTRGESRDATDRASSLSAQLNQQKVDNSTLTHQYAALLAKLTDAESEKGRYDEEIRLERDSHQSTRETMESDRQLANQRESSLNQHITALENKITHLQQQNQQLIYENQQQGGTAARDRPRGLSSHQDPNNAPSSAEQAQAYDRYLRLTDVLTTQVDRTLEELLVQFSADDVFVINSMCKSTANEVESRIATADMKIKDALAYYARQRETEDQLVTFTSSLLQENKELWNNINRLQLELEQANRDVDDHRDRALGLADAAPLRERIAYLEQQNIALEDDTRAVRQVVDEQKEREKEHESAARRLMEELKTLTQKYEHLQEDRAALQRTLDDTVGTAAEATTECEQLRDQANRLRKENEQYRKELECIEHDHRTQTELQLNELIEKIRIAQQERNEAQKDADQSRFQNEELNGRCNELDREIQQRDDLIAQLRQQIEETRHQCLTTLEHEITSQRNMYERELEDLRARCDELAARDHAPAGLVEDLHNDIQRLEREVEMERAASHEKDNEILDLRDQLRGLANDRDQAAERERDAANRAEAAQRESERAQAEMQRLATAVEAESSRSGAKLQAAEREVERLQEQVLESERQRQQLMEELQITRQSMRGAAANEDQLRQLREKWDRDRDELIRENERLQATNKQLTQKYVEAMEQNRAFREGGGAADSGAAGGSRGRDLAAGGSGSSSAARDPREVATLQARLEGQNRRLVEEQKKREDLEAERRKLQEHVRQLQQEKQVLETRMDHIVNQIRKEQELDLGAPMKSAMTQHRRLNDQTAEMDALINQSRGGSINTNNSNQQQQQPARNANNNAGSSTLNARPAATSYGASNASNVSSTAPVRRPPPAQPNTNSYGTSNNNNNNTANNNNAAGSSSSSWRP